jgi:hypothetical protein
VRTKILLSILFAVSTALAFNAIAHAPCDASEHESRTELAAKLQSSRA